jgi:hypothetical protein
VLELLFIIAFIAWLVVTVLQYLAGLAAAPTLLVAALTVPILAVWRSRVLIRRAHLEFASARRRPLPPERFYWPSARRRLGRRIGVATFSALAAWPVAIAWPARWSMAAGSATGWAAAAMAIASLAELAAALWLYVRASQLFDHLAPTALGWLRVGLYRLSDNHEFLGEEPLPQRKSVRESIY